MGFIEDTARSSFKIGENDESVYVNKGILFRAYIVHDSERAKQLLAHDRKTFKLFIPIVALTILFADLREPITLIPIIILAFVEFGVKKYLLRGLSTYKGKFKAKEALENTSEKYYPSVIMIFTALGALFLTLGLLFIFTSEDKAIGIAFFPVFISVVFFGASLYMYRANKSNNTVELDAKKDSRHSL